VSISASAISANGLTETVPRMLPAISGLKVWKRIEPFRRGPEAAGRFAGAFLWPRWKRLKQVDAAAQPHPNLQRLLQAAMQWRLLLACIRQVIAAPAGK
jgi:hypothetical protein